MAEEGTLCTNGNVAYKAGSSASAKERRLGWVRGLEPPAP